jgi:hypothetical protein
MRRLLKLAAGAVAFLVLVPAAASAEDPPFVDWTSVFPGLTAGYDPTSSDECVKGHENCVHKVIKEMDKRFQTLAAECDHNLMFAVLYLRTTEEYHRFWHEGHFTEPGWLNHYDVVFGSYYFEAQDDWTNARQSEVPEAWKIAFEAADNEQVSGLGNAFLGMSAHINRDLPFVLADIGMVRPDGTSRKSDHDTVNQFLNRVSDAVFPEVAARFDPTFDDGQVPGTFLDDLASFQAIPAWREQAWRYAERLVDAPTAEARALVAQEIEASAVAIGEAIKTATAYTPLSGYSAAERNVYCATNKDRTVW